MSAPAPARPRLSLTAPQSVTYAVPPWLRDEQIRVNTARVRDRITPAPSPRPDPVAVVGYGPSLRETWEAIRRFPFVITCSGSHRFLLDRGLIPTWHVEVDPRAHKIQLLGAPHPDVEYLVASTCHPDYVAHLAGYQVALWHVFDATEEGRRLLPPGEWAIFGGCDVGLRALTIASFLGFRELHVFGLDGCARDDDRHAGPHPHGRQQYAEVEHEGRVYRTTPAMLEAARGVVHELEQMPSVRTTFYGEGLIQALVRARSPRAEPRSTLTDAVAFAKPALISVEMRALNAQLHRENLAYGVGGGKHAPVVLRLVETLQTRSVLDYGCGKGYLAKALPFPIWEYDPAIPEKAESPRPADLVICTDVLEHVEPDKLPIVLDDLRRCTRRVGYFTIHTGPAQKTLADGRNTHLIQQGLAWWRRRLEKFFVIGKIVAKGHELHVIVGPTAAKKAQAA